MRALWSYGKILLGTADKKADSGICNPKSAGADVMEEPVKMHISKRIRNSDCDILDF